MKISLQNVGKQYAQQDGWALHHLSLEIAPGEFVALMGPSGCGKSTLLNLIGTMDDPSEGAVFLDGQNITQFNDSQRTAFRRQRMGFVFQFFNLLSTLTVGENVALPLSLNERKPISAVDPRIHHALEAVGLEDKRLRYPSQLSGGEMQRVAIARALIHQPALLLADEPTGNLDSENGEKILSLLVALAREQHKTLIMATHSEEAARHADRIIRLRDGHVIDVFKNTRSTSVQVLEH
jgi:putative ABC transport system ATP-binding protein